MNCLIHLANICQPHTLSHPRRGLRTRPLPAWRSHLLDETGQSLAPDSWVASVSLITLRSPEANGLTCRAPLWASGSPSIQRGDEGSSEDRPSSEMLGVQLLSTETRDKKIRAQALALET